MSMSKSHKPKILGMSRTKHRSHSADPAAKHHTSIKLHSKTLSHNKRRYYQRQLMKTSTSISILEKKPIPTNIAKGPILEYQMWVLKPK